MEEDVRWVGKGGGRIVCDGEDPSQVVEVSEGVGRNAFSLNVDDRLTHHSLDTPLSTHTPYPACRCILSTPRPPTTLG